MLDFTVLFRHFSAMKKTTQDLGQLIKSYRIKSNLTQKEVAEKIGYNIPQFISLMENGHAKIPLSIIGKLIVLLKIPEKTVLFILTENYRKEAMEQIAYSKKNIRAVSNAN